MIGVPLSWLVDINAMGEVSTGWALNVTER